MSWNVFILFSILTFTGTVKSVHLGVPNAIKTFKVSPDCDNGSCAKVFWNCYESDTSSFKVEFVQVHDGTTLFSFANRSKGEEVTLFGTTIMRYPFVAKVGGLKMDETYLVRVFAFNERGQSPPSPAVIFSLDPNRRTGRRRNIPHAPSSPRVEYSSEGQVNVTWTKVEYRENWNPIGPIEYVLRYGDNKDTALWKELKTNNTWIVLDDLKNGTVYSAYVVAREKNSTSNRSYTFPIVIGEDMTGLPEPELTIEPADKNGVFAPGDSMEFKCSKPPNAHPFTLISLKVGEEEVKYGLLEAVMSRCKTPPTIKTTANMNVGTASCEIYLKHGGETIARHSIISWKVKETLDDNHLQRINIRLRQ